MTRPAASATTERLYAGLPEVYRTVDIANGSDVNEFPLLRFLSLLGDQADDVNELAGRIDYYSPDDGGLAGDTSDLADPYAADPAWLAWLAQLVGATLPPGLDVDSQRNAIAGAVGGFLKGTKDGIAAAAQAVLTGSKYVRVLDHYSGDPWKIEVRTRPSETPSGAAVSAAIIAAKAKPAGVALVPTQFAATWAAWEAAYATWSDIEGVGLWELLEETGLAGAPDPGNADYGRDLRTWMQLTTGAGGDIPGGIALLPPGIYYAGDLGVVAGTNYLRVYDPAKPLNGWLVLKAQVPGTVFVDLSPTAGGFALTTAADGGALGHDLYTSNSMVGSFRLCFDDIDFVKGSVCFTGSDRVRFFNCRRSYQFGAINGTTAGSFKAHFDAACVAAGVTVVGSIPDTPTYEGVLFGPYLKRNNDATGFRFQGVASGPDAGTVCTRMWIVNCNIDGIPNDAIFWGSAHHCKVVGTYAINVSNASSDGVSSALLSRIFHNDGEQFTGAEDDVVNDHDFFGQHLEVSAEDPGSISGAIFTNLWVMSGGVSMSLSAKLGRDVSGTIGGAGQEYSWFSCGMGFSSDAGWDVAVSDDPYPDPAWRPRSALSITQNFTHITDATLATMGFTLNNGLAGQKFIADVYEVVAHGANPVNVWRGLHGPGDRDTTFAAINGGIAYD